MNKMASGQTDCSTAVPVTVLMPVFNGERYLRRAIDSVLAQSYRDFECLIIDDGSRDATPRILAQYRDPRIRILRTENRGLAAALTLGLRNAKGEYLARMDADDECLPNRLAIQKEYLDSHPRVVMVHAAVEKIDEYGHAFPTIGSKELSSLECKWSLIWRNDIYHPTVMMRTGVLRRHGLEYQAGRNVPEDFEFWSRLALLGQFGYVPSVLLRYRIHEQSYTRSYPKDLQAKAVATVIRENFQRYQVSISEASATELAIIGGQLKNDPISHVYHHLVNTLHVLSTQTVTTFCQHFSANPQVLTRVRSQQYTRWARYMINTSRRYAATLLSYAVRLDRAALASRLWWLVWIAIFLPRPLLSMRVRRKLRVASAPR